MCFALDHKQQKWIVIDGLQRISTIVKFLQGGDWKLSQLEDIDPEIAGKSVAAIKTPTSALHQYYTRVENLSVPVTVLRCDFKKKPHMEYLFTIFHRLNTGGMKLNNQEIRNCIYGGTFNNLLKELDDYTPWRRLNKMRAGQTYRFSKQEILLRFFAFMDRRKDYEGHLAKFLNDYMHANQYASGPTIEKMRQLFIDTIRIVADEVFEGKAPPKLSLTVLESLLVGVGSNLSKTMKAPALKLRYKELLAHPEFSEGALREGLSKKQRVIDRLNTAIKIFTP